MISRETLNELHAKTAANTQAKEVTSDLLKKAQDKAGNRTHRLKRDGKEIELKEKTLWDEVFYLGVNCQAASILRPIHPEVFAAFESQTKIAEDLTKFSILELGVDFTKLTLSDYLRMTEELFDLMLSERGVTKQ